jgi:cation diffusion facilitator family transporter
MSSTFEARERATIRSSWISLLLSIFIMGCKFAAYEMTHSTAVLSDAVESIVNVIAAIVAVFVIRAVSRPADLEHPYGHGKLEYFSAAFEGGLIAFASLAIANEAIRALFRQQTLNMPDIGAVVMAGSAVLNLLLALHLKSVGKKYKSEALLASGAHVLSDVWTTVGVIVGLGIMIVTKAQWVDPVVALLVAVQLGYAGYKIVRKSGGALMDEMEPQSLQELAGAFQANKQPWVVDIHNLKVIRSGHFHHIDGHLVVPEFWDVAKTHEHSGNFERNVVSSYPFDGEIAFHLDPCERKYCAQCEMPDCPIRVRKFEILKKFTSETLIRGPIQNGR